jgi:hypothetical protein
MAVGDAVAVYMGTAEGNRQPSSGVSEQITVCANSLSTDAILIYDGTNSIELFQAAVKAGVVDSDAGSTRLVPYNMAVQIDNSVYLRKAGTTDRWYIGGVQTHA